MPFKPTPGLIIVGFIIVIIIIGALALAASPGKPKSVAGLAVVTVKGEIGLTSVKIINLNTGTSIVKTSTSFPYSFNVTRGDTLQLIAATQPNYMFNAWVFNTGTFDNHNPLTVKVNADVTITAEVLYVQVDEDE